MTNSRPSRRSAIAILGLAMGVAILPAKAGDSRPGRNPPPIRSRSRSTPRPVFRSIDGLDPSRANPSWGAANVQLRRWMEAAYDDGMAAPAARLRPNARTVSQIVSHEYEAIPNAAGASAFLWQWGQFLDHDLDLTESAQEAYPIAVPAGDPFFDPAATGRVAIEFFRSIYDPATGHALSAARAQMNFITAFIDASNVYGSDPERAQALRTLDGTGRLLTSDGGLLPFNSAAMPNAGGDSPALFLAGDIRANEQIGLTMMHTLFVREHNRLADLLHAGNPEWPDERLYQQARAIVGAEMQAITYREFLPLLLGPGALATYEGYRESVDPSIANIFSTVAFRVGHTMLNAQLPRLQAGGAPVPEGPLALKDAFFRPAMLQGPGALEALLRGFASQRARAIDPFVTDAVRNFMFGAPGAGGLDLAALNIQRGRDHGLPDYNSVRIHLGLAPINSFAAISSHPDVQDRLEQAYGSFECIDPWVGGLAEDPVHGALVGELFFTVIKRQFENLRDGDPYWYERILDARTREYVESLTLSAIIRLNTEIGDELPADVFRAPANSPY
jgi:hypothetical protein